MTNELVKEIEEAVEKLVDIYEEDDPKCDFGVYRMRTGKVVGDTISTLQRAREALSWIPVSERLPEKSGNYRTTIGVQPLWASGILAMLSFTYYDSTKKEWKSTDNVLAWMKNPPYLYTPEEK